MILGGGGWPRPDTRSPWPCSGTCFMGYCCLPSPIMTCMGELALPPAPSLLIRGGQEIAWALDDKSFGCLAGGQRAQALPDGSLPINPSTAGGGCSGSGWAPVRGTIVALLPAPTLANPGTASWQLCLAGGLEKPRWLGAAGGKKWGGGPPCSPHFAVDCARICAQIPTPACGQGAGASFAPCRGRWVPWGGHCVARGVYLQTGGSWHRAAGHHWDPAAYNVNYHHVIKSP